MPFSNLFVAQAALEQIVLLQHLFDLVSHFGAAGYKWSANCRCAFFQQFHRCFNRLRVSFEKHGFE